MLSKKLILSILLLVCYINASEQLAISKADREKISEKIEQLSLSADKKDSIKSKISDLLSLFSKDNATQTAEVCTEPKWCEGFEVDACKEPETNQTACCLFCTEDTKLKTTTVAEKNTTVVDEIIVPKVETTTSKKFMHRTTTVSESDDETTTTLETTTSTKKQKKIRTTTLSTTTVTTTTADPALITLPHPVEYDYDSTYISGLNDPVDESVKSKKKTTTTTTTTVKPDASKVKASLRKLQQVMLDIDESDPKDVIIWKKSFERIPEGCPKEVGMTGCSIVEKCMSNSDCKKSGEKCCLKDCVRTCISV